MPDDMAQPVASRGREMAEDQFRSLAATHGGDLFRWPRGTRAPARLAAPPPGIGRRAGRSAGDG